MDVSIYLYQLYAHTGIGETEAYLLKAYLKII